MMLFSLLLIQKESARQKKVGATEDVEEVTTFILDHFNFIKNWVVQQAHSPTEPDKIVSWRRRINIALTRSRKARSSTSK